MTSTEVLARVAFATGAVILGGVGASICSGVLSTLAVLCLMVLIYRLRYGRF